MKVIAENWILKPRARNVSTRVYNIDRMETRVDIGYVSDDIVVVGTKKQLREFFNKMFWDHSWQLRDTFDYDIKDCYIKKYKENNNEPIIINLN